MFDTRNAILSLHTTVYSLTRTHTHIRIKLVAPFESWLNQFVITASRNGVRILKKADKCEQDSGIENSVNKFLLSILILVNWTSPSTMTVYVKNKLNTLDTLKE